MPVHEVLELLTFGNDAVIGSEFHIEGVRMRVVSAGKPYFAPANTVVMDVFVVPADDPAASVKKRKNPKPEA
jgi:hypothetical protein